MSIVPPPSLPKQKGQSRFLWLLLIIALVVSAGIVWQQFSNRPNATDPTVAGRPLSNPQTHLHTVVAGGQPGVLYLGTHYGLFTSTDGGHTWPQQRGVLNTLMVTAIAVSSSNPHVLAVIGLPSSGFGEKTGIYFSSDGGTNWQMSIPAGLSASAYPYTIRAGYAGADHFYAFFVFAGWFETQDRGAHWHAITSGDLSNMQTPSLLTDPAAPNHLLLGGDLGLYESLDDGNHWEQITSVGGNVQSIVASHTSPRSIFCVTDQGMFRWLDGNTKAIQLVPSPGGTPFTRLVSDTTGNILYGIAGQDLWYSADGGTTWKHRWQFDRADIISFVLDPRNADLLYTGFYLPGKVEYSTDAGSSWQTLTA